jgi:hypothetical protein
MTKLIKLTARNGSDVYVNPDRVLFVESHANEPGSSFIYFAEEFELAVKQDLAAVVSALTS